MESCLICTILICIFLKYRMQCSKRCRRCQCMVPFQSFFSWNPYCNTEYKCFYCIIDGEFQSFFSWNHHCNCGKGDCVTLRGKYFNPYFPGIIIATETQRKVASHISQFQSLFSWNHHCNCLKRGQRSSEAQISILIFLESSLQQTTRAGNREAYGISILIFLESSLQPQQRRASLPRGCISILIFLESSLQHKEYILPMWMDVLISILIFLESSLQQ